jgi:hypothetical protein
MIKWTMMMMSKAIMADEKEVEITTRVPSGRY